MLRRIYSGPNEDLKVQALAIDVQSGLVAMGGGEPNWIRIADFYSGRLLCVVRLDDMRAWTLAQFRGAPAVVAASDREVIVWEITRAPAQAAGHRSSAGPTLARRPR